MKKVLSVLLAALMIMSVMSIVCYAYTNIDFISIQGVTAPKAGAKPSYDGVNNNNATNFRIYTEYAPQGENIYNGVQWYDNSTNSVMDKNDTFQVGHQYTVTVYLINVGKDNMFPAYHVADVAEYINGKEAFGDFIDTSLWEGGYSPTYYVYYTFPIIEQEIGSIAVTGVTAPAKGAKPAYKATVASSAPYTITSAYDMSTIKNGVSWYDKTANKTLKSTDTFAVGHSYTVTVYLRAKEDYAFPRNFIGTATVNGKSAETNPADVLSMADYLQDYTVTYIFPAIVDDTTPINFPDVAKGDWFYDAVQYCAQRGFITGYKTGKFGPADPLQRQDFVVILARIAGADLAFYKTCPLSDVDMSAYYGPAVAWAVKENIIKGYDNGKFGVGDKITREQVATILYRYMGSPDVPDVIGLRTIYSDGTQVSGFAQAAMAWATQNGIITGKNGKLAPQDNASRAEIATIIMRMDKAGMFSA